jgi:hypothetical protein
MLEWAVSADRVTAAGDVFTIAMHNAEQGDYEIANHVVEYELHRRIGWEPVLCAASRPEDVADIGVRFGHAWTFELTPDGTGGDGRDRDLRLLPGACPAAEGRQERQPLGRGGDDDPRPPRRAVRPAHGVRPERAGSRRELTDGAGAPVAQAGA